MCAVRLTHRNKGNLHKIAIYFKCNYPQIIYIILHYGCLCKVLFGNYSFFALKLKGLHYKVVGAVKMSDKIKITVNDACNYMYSIKNVNIKVLLLSCVFDYAYLL